MPFEIKSVGKSSLTLYEGMEKSKFGCFQTVVWSISNMGIEIP